MASLSETNSVCCPEFDPSLWDDKVFVWENKRFIKDRVCTILYMPINFGKVMVRLNKVLTKAEMVSPDWLCLSEHTSSWKMDIYLAVDKEIQGVENVTFSGNFYCKVYEGSYNNTGKWIKDFEQILKSKGFDKKRLLMWYTTCPKCAKKYGKNYVAIMSQVG